MARVLVATQPWGLLWIKTAERIVEIPLQGEPATINTTVYAASTGSGTVTSFVTNDDGELPGWVEEGDYTLTVNGEAFAVSAVSGSLAGRVTNAEGRLTSLEGRLTTAESNISNLQSRMTTAESDITSLKTRATNLETRATNLESRATSLESRMTTAESNISNLQGRMNTAESNISNLQSRMTTAESNITNLQSRMTTAENNISSLQSRMTAVENRATTLENRINRGAFWAFTGDFLVQQMVWTKIPFGSKEFDVSNYYSLTNTRYQPTVEGYYRLNTTLTQRLESTVNFQMIVSVYKNGFEHVRLKRVFVHSGIAEMTVDGTCIVHANGSDYFEIWFLHSDTAMANQGVLGGKGFSFFQGEGI